MYIHVRQSVEKKVKAVSMLTLYKRLKDRRRTLNESGLRVYSSLSLSNFGATFLLGWCGPPCPNSASEYIFRLIATLVIYIIVDSDLF